MSTKKVPEDCTTVTLCIPKAVHSAVKAYCAIEGQKIMVTLEELLLRGIESGIDIEKYKSLKVNKE